MCCIERGDQQCLVYAPPSAGKEEKNVGKDDFTLDVQMTFFKLIFMNESQFTRSPLYVSPFFSSTSWEQASEND